MANEHTPADSGGSPQDDELVVMHEIDWTEPPETVRVGDDGVLALPPRFHESLGVGAGQTLVSSTTSMGILIMTPEAFLDCPADRIGDRARQDVTREELVVSGRARRRALLDELFAEDAS